MRDTFLRELNDLSMQCGISLQRLEQQAAHWVREFGSAPDEVIKAAFAKLREPGGFEDRWPTYQELKRAFAFGRDRLRNQMDAQDRREDSRATVPAGRFRACMDYAVIVGRNLAPEEIEAGIVVILSPKTTDAEVRAFLAEAREKFASRPAPPLAQPDEWSVPA